MDIENINRIERLASGEFFIGLEGEGKPIYQYVYRAASGVYWDEERKKERDSSLLQ